MLHVFLVDIGIMLKFEMELAVDSVSRLMEAVHLKVFIPANKQVLLSADGEPLNPTNRVASYASAGTETQPIYLFSKSTIESPIPPSPCTNLRSEASLKEEVEKSLQMKPKYETLVARAKLAMDFQRIAVELGENCENLLNDQVLQKKGWIAVIKNLDHITSAFKSHLNRFEELYSNFQQAQTQYNNMLQSFQKVFALLKQLPVFDCLPGMKPDTRINLLEWISSHDQQSSLDNLVAQCQEAVKQCKLTALEEIMAESRKVLEFVDNFNMKDIKGLNERLTSLEHRVSIVQQLVQDQTDMAQGFQQNQMRAEHIGDASVLPDLCVSHQKQLIVLLKNQHQIRDIHNLCAKAKDELSTNLHARLRWVMYVERSIYEHDSKLLVYHENLRRIKKRLDILEQVYEAPRMYVCACLEVMRRKNFSAQFSEWCSTVSQSSIDARTEELAKRKMFQQVFNNHFVKTLFPGIDYEPPPFAEEPLVLDGDGILPDISVEDFQLLQQRTPELMCEINLDIPLVSSMIVRDTFSQSNLSKLVDPRQNKILEETLNFREKTQVDNQLTMSILKREISCKTVGNFAAFDDDVQFEVDGIKESSKEDDEFQDSFEEPSSLKSLPEEKRLMMSDDSDALFHSAELEFSGDSSMSPAKSPKSGKSSSSPIAIKGKRSYRRLSVKSLGHEDEAGSQKGNVFSLPVLTKTDFSTPDHLSGGSSTSMINCRSLSEAIKSTEVIKNIKDSADIVRMSKLEVVKLRSFFNSTHVNIVNLQDEFSTTLTDMKVCLTDILNQDISSCKNCIELQERYSETDSNSQNEINRLKEQYLEVISEKDRMFMEHEAREEKLLLLTDENIKLKEMVKKYEEEVETLRTELQNRSLVISDKDTELTNLNMMNSRLMEEASGKDTELTNLNLINSRLIEESSSKDTELTNLNLEKGKLVGDTERCNLEITDINNKLSELNSQRDKLIKDIEERNLEIAERNNELSLVIFEREKLMESSSIMNENLQTSTLELEDLRDEIKSLKLSRQLSSDNHIEQVSTTNVQLKELKRYEKENDTKLKELEQKVNKLDNIIAEKDMLLAKKEQQLSELLQRQGSLEAQNQTNFNFVLNKIRKEKDVQLNELKTTVKTLEKELASSKHKHETLNQEINVHKAAYTEIQEQLETEKDKCMQYELSMSQHGEIFAENNKLKSELNELKNNMEKVLEKEKASLLLNFELEKECALEEYGKSEMVIRRSKSTSIEEGIDELEIERLLEKVKNLEEENTMLKNGSGSSKQDKFQVNGLIQKLKSEKLAVRNIEAGHLVILCLDEIINQYTVLHLSPQRYFLHPDSLKVVRKLLEKPDNERRWMLAYVNEIEICVCKKANNKFNLPVNSYFTRIRISPYELDTSS